MNKACLAAVVAAFLFPASARSADLPARSAPPDPGLVPVFLFSWTGFYAGANAGYGLDVGRNPEYRTLTFPPGGNLPGSGFTNQNPDYGFAGSPLNVFTFPVTLNLPTSGGYGDTSGFGTGYGSSTRGGRGGRNGFVGGLQVGYNHQFTPGSGVVVGVEADAQYADLNRQGRPSTLFIRGVDDFDTLMPPLVSSKTFVERLSEPGVTNGRSSTSVTVRNPGRGGVEWFGTVRGRLGYALDRVLLYGTGGFAYGAGGDDGRIRTGWTGGGGVEYALAADSILNPFGALGVSIKAEALYVNLDKGKPKGGILYATDQRGYGFHAPADAFAGGARRDEFVVARVGVNYRF
jgi:outer membrane immunogenic protein